MGERAKSSTPAYVKRKRRGPIRATLRFARNLLLALLAFGFVVSVASDVRTPPVEVSTAPDTAIRVSEITGLYPVNMARVATPRTVEEISRIVAESPGPISIGGGRNSMGGQTATPDGLQIDLREFHGVVSFDPAAKTITVHSGTRWREVQEAIDRADLAVKIMQTYNTFTVGGALSVNAHGRYIGQGPLVRSVVKITLVLADGRVVTASPTENADLFYAAIGGYGAVGVIADVTLDLAANSRVRRDDETLPVSSYSRYFKEKIRDDSAVIFHNADIYPPKYEELHAVSYRETYQTVTVPERLLPRDQAAWTHRAAYAIITGWPGGPWIRQHVMDPWTFRGNPVTWRNYEASYDVSELEPASREKNTYALEEFFIPVGRFDDFVARMRDILSAHRVNAVNVSVRHALPDPGTLLAWAPTEVFAFVLYYRQGTDPAARHEVGTWTRELIDAALACGGRYYLPYQPTATRAQFARAYPRSRELFDVKRRVDPGHKFTNTLWDMYLPQSDGSFSPATPSRLPAALPAEARIVLDGTKGYQREEGAALFTHPEWDLVYTSDAYSRWLAAGKKPSGFPYISSVGTFWRSYRGTWQDGQRRYPFPIGSHVLLGFIGVSTAIEYGLKEVYECTFGRLSELAMPPGGTDEDRYAAKVAADYVDLIERVGWYEFDFRGALERLWTTVPKSGPGQFRKWERRFALSAEYGIKAAYAAFTGFLTHLGYTPDEMERGILAVGWQGPDREGLKVAARLDRGYTLLTAPRYNPYREALVALSDRVGEVRLVELSGCEVAAFSGTAPRGWVAPPRTTAVVAYAVPTDPTRVRVLLRAPVRDLLEALDRLRKEGAFRIEHIYDY
jgi:FAD/FMN-containing dehydrogenase